MSAPTLDAALRARRRQAVRQHPTLTGLDAVELHAGDERRLVLHFLPPAPEVEKAAVPAGITAANVRIAAAGEGTAPLEVTRVERGEEETELLVTPDAADIDAATAPSYTLTLVDLPTVDPFFDSASFSFEVDEARPFDCAGGPPAAGEELPGPEIDYLVRDFAGFRRLMLERLSLRMPDWRQASPVDWPVAVVEALAAAADEVSYFQDAVATEAYLGTARKRTSIRRHARLLDYRVHEGCTARAWIAFEVAEPVSLAPGARLLTRLEGSPPARLEPESPAVVRALAGGVEVFETLHPAHLVAARNELRFYRWGAGELWLDRGATAATLVDLEDAALEAGDVLIFEEKRGPATGEEADAEPEHRHAVRLTRVRPSCDPLTGVEVLEIAWHAGDALPFPLCVAAVARGRDLADVAVARGNVVPAAHGRSVENEPPEPEIAPADRPYRPRLRRRGLAHSVPWDNAVARSRPAAEALVQDPRAALAEIRLEVTGSGEIWTPRRDLLAADRFARELVVEMEDDGTARLRFGDGVRGRRPAPGMRFSAYYRVGNGAAGNVGRDAIAHLMAPEGIADGIVGVRNPLAARGGIDPEPLARVRLD
ncbi:MAG: putative baseplate assembly protein, partial [FCB group bacterium]|nr:putative baseplate assembly protein [FCB group bacterium]